MKQLYRVLNGMKASGVPKLFTPEDIELRKQRLEAGRAARLKKLADLKRKREERKAFVKAMAAQGIFVPVSDFE